MFLRDINVIDVFIESGAVIGACFLLLVLVNASKRYPSIGGRDWNTILAGFTLMLLGFGCDWTDEFIDYLDSPLVQRAQEIIEEIGLICGIFLSMIGFRRWFKFISRYLRA